MSDRKGFTLTELLITMGAGSALMVLAVGLVHQSMHLTAVARRGADEHRAMSRLASQFRDDVRLADQVVVDTDNQIRISIPQQGEIIYRAEAETCIRTAVDSSMGDGNSQVGQENYTLQRGGGVRFEILVQPQRAAIVLSRGGIAAMSQSKECSSAEDIYDSARLKSLRVEAVVGAVANLLERRPQE